MSSSFANHLRRLLVIANRDQRQQTVYPLGFEKFHDVAANILGQDRRHFLLEKRLVSQVGSRLRTLAKVPRYLHPKSDLKRLYQSAWSGELAKIKGTPIQLVKPFHNIGGAPESLVAVGQIQTVLQPPTRPQRS